MAEGVGGEPPQLSDLQGWAESGASYWIVADPNAIVIEEFWPEAFYWGMDKLLRPGVEVALDDPLEPDDIQPLE
ncbi:MAG: hypothetical protein B7733_18190 [Myxococcales bacterium FL481]|nr:MAG: hypothetical protein B7733_18190 [Myxococcales bacterium FL481]